jgi:hypothetical protein
MRVKEKVVDMKVVEMIEIKHLIRNSYKVMRGKMKKLMKNLEGVGMNTNKIKILITGLREGHQMNRAKKSYRSMLLSFPTIFLTIFLLLLTFSIPVSAENPKAAQWESVGGEMILSGDHKFTTSWTSQGHFITEGLYWQGGLYLPHKERKYTPWENTVKNSVCPKKGQITVRGPGNVGKFQRGKWATIVMRNTETGSGFTPWTSSFWWVVGKGWQGSVSDFNTAGEFWGYIPADVVVTLDVEAHMLAYDNVMNTGEYTFFAPQEVEYEVWFFPREGGEVINVTKYGPDGKEIGSDLEFKWSVDDNSSLNLPPMWGEFKFAGNAGETMNDEATNIDITQDTRTEKEIIMARLAVIERLAPEERKKHRDEHVRLWGQLYLMNSREEALSGSLEDASFVVDKTLGYTPGTSTVWGISTGTIQLIQGNYKDAMNRYLGVIPCKNLGTAYSALLDILSLYPPINYEESKKWDPLAQPRPPDDPAPVIFLNQ